MAKQKKYDRAKDVRAIARERVPASVLKAYNLKKLKFGPDYILPKPFDPRLAERVPQAVAKAVKKANKAGRTR